MKFEILKYLISHKEGTGEEFTKFLRTTFAKSSRKLVRDTLLEMHRNDLIAGPSDWLLEVFKPKEDLHLTMENFPGVVEGWGIRTAGENQYFDDDHRSHERKVSTIAMQADLSTSETNASIKSLNEVIIPRFNRFQQRATIVTLIVASLSLTAIIVPLFKRDTGVTSGNIKDLTRQIKANTAILDSIRRYEKGIDSSLRKIASDTSHRKVR